MRFKERRSYHSIKKQDESASADEQAITKFPNSLKKIIEESGFHTKQILYVDNTGLLCKNLPDRLFISNEEKTILSYKFSKVRENIMLVGISAGDFKLKPLLVYHAHNPQSLKNIPKASLPVIWTANSKAWVTGVVFEDWFFNHFIPAAEEYCKEKAIPFKVLLILDNTPDTTKNIVDFESNVTIVYPPPNITSFLQPMDQGIIAIFKRYYMKHTLQQVIAATDLDESITLQDFWKSYDIYKAVKNIAVTWNDVRSTAMNGVSNKISSEEKLFPEGITNIHDDSAPIHVAKVVTEWYEEHSSEFEHFIWPPQIKYRVHFRKTKLKVSIFNEFLTDRSRLKSGGARLGGRGGCGESYQLGTSNNCKEVAMSWWMVVSNLSSSLQNT
ncbi:tigger transposable element-derived protein 1-like [Octopus sinensis]|uniref:Tigger transposable element-derived protein 1-like n=1 Tax=Octopus sinensis TaxID=2607531 RepID=A0A6P7T7Q7_9MOLL|nr:tigger transposable element-derived protein 1-like [Octopus sinensis]